ncbi:MAG: ribonuclease P protein subunit [Nanoarchaeota archaeon]|nr:ribonuclease P protein subunit [Nanoarchaeota archaeon]
MKEITKDELIGLDVEVIGSKNKSDIGIKGKIIDETKNCLVINTKNGEKKMIKENIIIKIPEKGLKLDGKLLANRPEDRIKKG